VFWWFFFWWFWCRVRHVIDIPALIIDKFRYGEKFFSPES
jgi:hypothetical protein